MPFAYGIRPTRHLFTFVERAARLDGETQLEGLASSTLRNLTRRICVVPAGHLFQGWHVPSIPVEGHKFPYRRGLAASRPRAALACGAATPSAVPGFREHRGDGRQIEGVDRKQGPWRPHLRKLFVCRAPVRIVPARMRDGRRSAAEGRLRAVAGEARSGLYRGEPCGPPLARVAGAARRLEHIPFRPCLQAHLWSAAAPVLQLTPHRERQGAPRGA